MDEKSLKVSKTLVIGLGSTGTRICNSIADRLKWELGDIHNAPWVKFLCLETDENEKSVLSKEGDFMAMSLSPEDFRQIVTNPQQYAESLLHGDWADIETLRKLPNQAVNNGAGNIRMVGRLVFLHNTNYNLIHGHITRRLTMLQGLHELPASQVRRGVGMSEPRRIEFNKGEVQVFVVGTLCGGTGSGLAADFGIYLNSRHREGIKTTAIFTLPHPDLSSAVVAHAERYKVNAFHALTELNYYSAVDASDTKRQVNYADHGQSDPGTTPYNSIYLVTPSGPDVKSEGVLNATVGDYIFMRTMVPETDPAGAAADVNPVAKNGIYPGFSTFGFGVLEFPAQRVVDACSKRLLLHAFTGWRARALPKPGFLEQGISALGLNWDQLELAFLRSPNCKDIEQTLKQIEGDLVSGITTSATVARRSLSSIRSAFAGNGGAPGAGVLSAGSIPAAFRKARSDVSVALRQRFREVCAAWLLDFEVGPSMLNMLIKQADEQLTNLVNLAVSDTSSKVAVVDQLMVQVTAVHENGLIKLCGLKKTAIERLRGKLRVAIADEVRARITAEIVGQLTETANAQMPGSDGILTALKGEMAITSRRLVNLQSRVLTLINHLTAKATELSDTRPMVNGVCLFHPGPFNDNTSTVGKAYESCLKAEAASAVDPYTVEEAKRSSDVIAAWHSLPAQIAPEEPLSPAKDLYLSQAAGNSEKDAIAPDDFRSMEEISAVPFMSLVRTNVLQRWHEEYQNSEADRNSTLKEVHAATTPLLRVDEASAQDQQFQPRKVVTKILRDDSQGSAALNEFDEILHKMVLDGKPETSPDAYRALIVRHFLGFPLTAVPSITQPRGLADAKCKDFPTFFTRADIAWTPLPKRATEHEMNAQEAKRKADEEKNLAIRKVAQTVAVAVLLKLLEIKKGKLVAPGISNGLEPAGEFALPTSAFRAAEILKAGEPDDNGRSTTGFLDVVGKRVKDAQRVMEGESAHAKNESFVGHLRAALASKIGVNLEDAKDLSYYATRFCSSDPDLRKAMISSSVVEEAVVQSLVKRPGDSLPQGRVADVSGLYCTECGSWIAPNRDEAAALGWSCHEMSHYFGPSL